MADGRTPVATGDVIAGRYRVESWIGQGNMAIVFRAKHTVTGRSCALKVVHSHLVTRQEFIDLFVKEAQVGGRIGQSSYIVDVLDAGVDEARRLPFLAMELLDGEPLDHHVQKSGALAPALVGTLFQQLAEALDQAHRAGVVHRDLKPGNLFLVRDRKGEPMIKVVDFGIAKVLEQDAQHTATQVGSPAYAAPEQLGPMLRKLAAKQQIVIAPTVSPATDVWALGLVAYELLTGLSAGHYWGAGTGVPVSDLVMSVALEEGPPASVRAGDRSHLLPAGFDAWFARCTRKNAAERWPTAGAAVNALTELLQETSAQNIDSPTRIWKPVTRTVSLLAATPQPEPSARAVPAPVDSSSTLLLPEVPPPTVLTEMSSGPIRPFLEGGPAETRVEARERKGFRSLVAISVALALGSLAVAVALLLRSSVGQLKIYIRTERGALVERVDVFVDGQRRCSTSPCVVDDLAPGSRIIKAVSPDTGEKASTEVTVETGKEKIVPLTLSALSVIEPGPASPDGGAQAVIDAGTPDDPEPAPSTKEPVKPLGSAWPKPAATLETSESSKSGTGTLNINSIPVSKVVLDGKPLGSTPKVGISVPAGSHVVIFIHPELGKRSVTVKVKDGETKTAATKFK